MIVLRKPVCDKFELASFILPSTPLVNSEIELTIAESFTSCKSSVLPIKELILSPANLTPDLITSVPVVKIPPAAEPKFVEVPTLLANLALVAKIVGTSLDSSEAYCVFFCTLI